MAHEPTRGDAPRAWRRMWTAITTRPWPAWWAARAATFAVGLLTWAFNRGNVFIDITYYGRWAFNTLDGTAIPYRDFAWEYPPMAMPGMLAPAIVTAPLPVWRYLPYLVVWIVMVLFLDALIMRSIVKRAGTSIRHPAVLLWVLGPALLGALTWTRFDILAALAAFAAVLHAGTMRARASGLVSGVGATLKLWPGLLAPVQRTRGRAVVATLLAGLVVLGVGALTWLLTGSTGFSQVLSYQADRGLQIESLAALPLVWMQHLGVEGYGSQFAFGAWEITGPGTQRLATLATVTFAAGLVLVFLGHWRLMRRDARSRGVGLTAVLLLLVILATNKVFSPQYVVWLLAAATAAAVLDPELWRRFVKPVLALALLTQLVFPLFYGDILNDAWPGLIIMTGRDVLLLWLVFQVTRELVRELQATRTRERGIDLTSADGAGTGTGRTGGAGDDLGPRLPSEA